jgi:hypothetical protein
MTLKANLSGANFTGNITAPNNTRYNIVISRWNEFK